MKYQKEISISYSISRNPLEIKLIYKLLFEDFIYLFVERPEWREKEREKHQPEVASHMPQTRDLAHNTGKCPDWELNQRPPDSQAGTQSTKPHQPGLSTNY